MKQRKDDFSHREYKLIHDFIEKICRAFGCPSRYKELYQCAWVALLSVYRGDPSAFLCTDSRGWRQAYQVIWNALEQEQKWFQTHSYQTNSFDQPVSSEVSMPRIELLQSPHGDFQNSVCFYDFLNRTEQDVRRMAYGLLQGNSMEEIRSYYHWNQNRTSSIYHALRVKMREYLEL